MHHYEDLITLFKKCFFKEYNTVLVRGENEPLYLPADKTEAYNRIYFAHGYFSSALHECSHWFIAGEKRRKQVDYGYWYEPDERTSEQQKLFEAAEVKPQALEWILANASQSNFNISLDNFYAHEMNNHNLFKSAVHQQVKIYSEQGLPKRAETFWQALCNFYQTPLSLRIRDFEFK